MGDVYCLSNNSPGSFRNEFPTSHNVTQVSSTLSQILNFQIVHSLKKQKRNKNKIIKAPITRKIKKEKKRSDILTQWYCFCCCFLQSSVALRFCYLRLEIRCQRVDNMLWAICLKRDSFLTVNRRDCCIANLIMLFPLCTVWIADKPFRRVFHVLSSPSDASLK